MHLGTQFAPMEHLFLRSNMLMGTKFQSNAPDMHHSSRLLPKYDYTHQNYEQDMGVCSINLVPAKKNEKNF